MGVTVKVIEEQSITLFMMPSTEGSREIRSLVCG